MRKWAVTIGPPGGQGRMWDGLRVGFTVEKTGDSTPNKLKLSVYNLDADARAFVSKKGMAVRLEAGYQDSTKLLFSGSLELVSHTKPGPDWVSAIESADGVRAYRSVVLSESFGPNTSEKSVIEAAAKKMGVTVGELKGLPENAKFNQGRQLSGPASRELDALCRKHGLRWSIQDEVLQIVPIGQGLSREAVLLSADTGLIGSPEKTERGVKMVSLLQGGINPGQLIQLESRSIKGLFIAENVTHQGDTEGDEWHTVIEGFAAP